MKPPEFECREMRRAYLRLSLTSHSVLPAAPTSRLRDEDDLGDEKCWGSPVFAVFYELFRAFG
jgi:hypothetical protein